MIYGLADAPAPVYAQWEDEGIFGLPKTIALVGGAVLVLGIAAFALSSRTPKRALSGYKRKKRRK